MRVLSLDPSSRCTGWAVLDGLEPDELVDGGLIKPSASRTTKAGSPEHQAQDLADWYAGAELAAARRILETLEDVAALVPEYQPDRVLVEIPSGKAGTGSKKGAKSSLAVYGLAAGAVWACLRSAGAKVVAITERQWTPGSSKAGRGLTHEALYPGRYMTSVDAGLDLSDAIGMARWYFARSIENNPR